MNIDCILYAAIDDEEDWNKYPDGLRIEIFLTEEAREKFIAEQLNFGDWITTQLKVTA